jgi:hypothetical protein
MSDTAKTKNPPVAKIKVGLVTASIWENRGEKSTTYSATFDRRYKDKEGNWHSSDSYNADDLLAKAKAADLAHTKILELQAMGE